MSRGRTSRQRAGSNPSCPWCESESTRVDKTQADKYVEFEGEEIRPPRTKYWCRACGGQFAEIRIIEKIAPRETAVADAGK